MKIPKFWAISSQAAMLPDDTVLSTGESLLVVRAKDYDAFVNKIKDLISNCAVPDDLEKELNELLCINAK